MIANKWTLGNSAGQDLLITVCGEYKGAYLSELLEFLCANGVSINQVDYEKRNALMKLSKNDPTSGQEVYEAVRILIRREINVNQIDFQGCNALFHFIRNRRVRCCRYCWLVEVNRSTFWEILELLLSAGADVDQTDEHGDTVLFEILSKISSRDWNHIPCPSCIQLKRTTENTNGIGHFYRVLRFVERLLKAGVSTYVKSEEDEEKNESVLFYVCAHFTGDELMELVELLCANGVSVNCRTTRGNSRKPLNALQVLEMENPTQASRITQLMDIMKRYGFKP